MPTRSLIRDETPLAPAAPAAPAAAPATAAAPPAFRDFGDHRMTRQFIYDDVLQAAGSLEPTTDDRHTLALTDVRYVDPEKYTRRQQKEAILTGGTLGRRMKGTWELRDNATGDVIDRREQVVARVPFLTHRGTFIHRGNEYTLNHQQRLLPGVFTRRMSNGQLEAHVNILPGKGLSHRYFLDPEKGVFKMKVGQAEMPLLPLLRVMGATDDQLREAWGKQLLAANYKYDDPSVAKKLAQRIVRRKDQSDDEGTTRQRLKAAFEAMEVDEHVTGRTLGRPYKNLSLDAMLDTTRKLLAVSRGEAKVDDRDHLAYQTFLGPEDLFAERLRKDHSKIRRALLKKAALAGNLSRVPAGALTPQLEQAILGSGLGAAIEEINPAELYDKQSRVTRLGEGGIPSTESVPDEARSVQPSHMGYIDPLRTPESQAVGIDLNMARNARKGRDGRLYARFSDPRTGREVWKSPQDIADSAIAFPGVLKRPGKRVPVMKGGQIAYVRKRDVDLVLPNFEDAFSPLGNMVPLKSMVKGQRVAMASRMLTQALALREGQSPLVQGALPGQKDRSFEEEYGKQMGAVHAEKDGRVVGYKDGVMRVKFADGSTDDIELYENFPFNRKSVTGSTRVWVKKTGGSLWEGRIDEYEFADGDRVLSVDVDTKRSAWCRITGFVRHRNDKKLLRVRTTSGRHVDVTVDHSLVTIGGDGSLRPVYPTDVVPGTTRLPVALLPSGRPSAFAACDDMGTFAGLYLAEGHLPEQAGMIMIAVEPDDRADEVIALIGRLGHKAYRNGGNVCVTAHELRGWLEDNFGSYAHGKFVSPDVLGKGIAFRCGLIAGYFAGDGCLWSDGNDAIQVAAVSVSRRLRDGVAAVLSSLGVFSTFFDAPRAHLNDQWRDAYGLRVLSSHLAKLPLWSFYADRQRRIEARLKSKFRSSPYDAVPVPRQARKRFYDGFDSVPKFVYKTASLGYVAKHRVADCDGVFGRWGRSDVMWDVVESVEEVPYEEWVYDFCVESSEVFAVNGGLVVHNSFIHQTPLVQPGQTFKAGQPLVRSNFTDDQGRAALGVNARVAYLPWKGYNFEDAIVVSESMAKRMTSEHAYQHDLEVDDRTRLGKRSYVSLFPQKFDKQALARLDDDGVVKPGTVVEYGQPLILAARQKDQSVGKIHKRKQAGFNDNAILWKHHDPGVVTDVARGKKGPVVLVRSYNPMQVGDKMSGRYGDKGVVAAIVPDDQMPHGRDGRPYEVLLNPLGVISRCYDEQTEFLTFRGWKFGRDVAYDDVLLIFDPATGKTRWGRQQAPFHVADYSGKMLHFEASHADFMVTPDHKMWAKSDHSKATWQQTTAERIAFHRWWVPTVGNSPVGGTEIPFVVAELPWLSVKDTQSDRDRIAIDAVDFATFLGWYLAEGHTVYKDPADGNKRAEYKVFIAQDENANPAYCEEIAELLDRLPFKWRYKHSTQQFVIGSKRLAAEMRKFGKAHEKYVTRWLFDQPPHVRQAFLDALWKGDGHNGESNTGEFKTLSSVSERLIDDVQLLLQLQGVASIKRKVKVKPGHRPMWRCAVMLKKTDRLLSKHGWSEVDYVGKIYCPTVETGYVVTRRNGKPLIAGNTNPSQMVEAMLGKIAERTGRPVKVPDFEDVEDMTAWAEDQLRRHNIKDLDDVTIPELGVKVGGVASGNRFFMKLHHTSESKLQGRAGGSYSADETPAKGGETGCFVYETPVTVLLDGRETVVPLGWLASGKHKLPVRSATASGRECWATVKDHFEYAVPASRLVEVELADGRVLVVTDNHVMYMADGTTKLAGQLGPDDELLEVAHG